MEMLSRDEAERRIRERAVSDPAFRAQLKEDPRAALEAELGMTIPSEINVSVHEESLTEVHVVIPTAREDLSDRELEMVSGGYDWLHLENPYNP
jgi:hypothetical protein